MTSGDLLRTLREERGMSQAQLARASAVPAAVIHDLEHAGEPGVPARNLLTYADRLLPVLGPALQPLIDELRAAAIGPSFELSPPLSPAELQEAARDAAFLRGPGGAIALVPKAAAGWWALKTGGGVDTDVTGGKRR